MPDWGGGLFTAFMAAKDVGNDEGGQGEGGDEGGSDELARQNALPGVKPGAVQDHPGWNPQTGTCNMHPDGCENSMDPNRPNRPGPFKSGGGGQPPRQGGAWGRGRGFGK